MPFSAALRPTLGPRTLADEVGRSLSLLLLAAVLMTSVVGARLVWDGVRLRPEVQRSERAAMAVEAAHVDLVDMETGLRAYLASGQDAFLAPYRLAEQRVRADQAALVADAPRESTAAVVAFEVAQRRWIDGWATVAVSPDRPRPGDAAALSDFLVRGKVLFDDYRACERVLSDELRRDIAAARWTESRIISGSGFVVLGIGLVTVALVTRRRRRVRAELDEPMRELGDGVARLLDGRLVGPALTPRGPRDLQVLARGLNELTELLADKERASSVARAVAEEHARQTRLVLGVAREIAGSLNLRYVLEAAAEAASDIAHSRTVRLWLTAEGGAALLDLAFDTSYGRAGHGESAEMAFGVGPGGRAAKYGRPSHGEGPEIVDGAVVALPLIVGARVVGVLEAVAAPGADAGSDAGVVTALETLATHAAAAIESARLHETAQEQSLKDALTALPNRRLLDQTLSVEVERSIRHSRSLSVLFVDLDHFKSLNDRFGHAYGDTVLQQVATVLRDTLRTGDSAYRLGGEEFVVVLPETPQDAAVQVAERIRAAVSAPVSPHGRATVTTSVGVATLPEHGATPAALVAAADAALYRAKSLGRDQVAVAEQVAGLVPAPR